MCHQLSATYLVHAARLRGELRHTTCVRCGVYDGVVGHHADYEKPMQVVWLCRHCHPRWHKEHPVSVEETRRRRSEHRLVLRLAAESGCDLTTTARWLDGLPGIRPRTEQALTMAAARLKIRRDRRVVGGEMSKPFHDEIHADKEPK
jgi:hypothetical protein